MNVRGKKIPNKLQVRNISIVCSAGNVIIERYKRKIYFKSMEPLVSKPKDMSKQAWKSELKGVYFGAKKIEVHA